MMKTIQKTMFAAAIGIFAVSAGHADDKPHMTVFKTPWCGCCESWAHIMKAEGYSVEIRDVEDLSLIKTKAGIPQDVEGCHTAVLANYVLEGHVPAAAIDKLMSERPDIRGIAVPGMPEGSPGMGDDPNARYSVYSLPHDPSGKGAVFFEAGK